MSQIFDSSKPFDVPPLPPREGLETMAILKASASAYFALGRLNQASQLIPNPDVLINTLPLLEAKASTAIENIVTTNDALFTHAELGEESADPATKETLRYRTALKDGFESLREKPISTSTAVRICSTIKNREMDIRKVPGTTLKNPQTNAVIYTPPVGEAVIREKLANWEHFIHEQSNVDALIRMAAAHYQFEAIHPFTDGNGRTGRLLNQLMLVEAKLLDSPILYLSRYIVRNRASYYRLLLDVTANGAWEPWVVFMLEGVRDTADWTVQKIGATKSLMEHTAEYVKSQLPKIYSRELVELTFVQPYSRIDNLVDAEIAKRQTASVYLKSLAAIGVLQERKEGREKLFIHPKYLGLLTSEEHTFSPYAAPLVSTS